MGIIKNMAWNMLFANDMEYVLGKIDIDDNLLDLQIQAELLIKDAEAYKKIVEEYKIKYADLYEAYNSMIAEELKEDKSSELEKYWNNKRPFVTAYTYHARPSIGSLTNLHVDPRIFFMNHDKMPSISGEGNDAIAKASLQYVIKNITYTPDMTQFKDNEVWLFPFETLALKKGDCEDGAILLANILVANGVPYWRVRIVAGDVDYNNTTAGHCFCTYLSESDNKWYILDWCYFSDESLKGKLFKDAEKYIDIWFSFNQRYIYLNDEMDRQ